MFFHLLSILCSVAFAQLPATYESWKAQEKLDLLWNERITPSRYEKLPSLSPFSCPYLLAQLNAPLALLSLGKTFDVVSDEMPKGRRKFIHPFGSVVKIKWQSKAGKHLFTGIFSGPSEALGLARLSLAGPPAAIGFTPGIALKIFLDGQPSLNLMAMHSLAGQGKDTNFFGRNFSTILPPVPFSLFRPTSWVLKGLEAVFSLTKPLPRELPVTTWAAVNALGQKVESPVVPRELIFFPAPAAAKSFWKQPASDFRENLALIPKGTILYSVWGKKFSRDQELHEIGNVVTDSEFVSSEYADRLLFFRHPR